MIEDRFSDPSFAFADAPPRLPSKSKSGRLVCCLCVLMGGCTVVGNGALSLFIRQQAVYYTPSFATLVANRTATDTDHNSNDSDRQLRYVPHSLLNRLTMISRSRPISRPDDTTPAFGHSQWATSAVHFAMPTWFRNDANRSWNSDAATKDLAVVVIHFAALFHASTEESPFN